MGREEQRRAAARELRRKRKRRQQRRARVILVLTIAAVVCMIVTGVYRFLTKGKEKTQTVAPVETTKYIEERPELIVELLDINEYSRPGTALEKVNGIVVHYTANPGTTAEQNRGYFEGLAQSGETYASSHFVIGLEGEVVQCIPLDEVAYASNNRNSDTISIECCHPDETGKFYDSTYQTLVNLCAYLCVEFDLKPDDIIRHYDVTGKICPKYFVDHPEEWETFHKDVKNAIRILKK